ncbi:MAG: alpha/beta hydrolase [Bacillota bacterium]
MSAVGFFAARFMLGPFYLAGFYNIISPPGIKERKDIQFGEQERLKLDIYHPHSPDKNMPVVVFFHGGGWDSNNKDVFSFVGRSLARQGLMVVIPNYRLAPDYKYPIQVKDAALAVKWVEDNISSYGVIPGQIILSGHSAGAHLAAMVGFSSKWQKYYDLNPDNIKKLVLLSGVYKFSPGYSEGHEIIKNFVPEEYWQEAQPTNHLEDKAPYTIIWQGGKDRTVYPIQAEFLAGLMQKKDLDFDLKIFSRHNHFSLLISLTKSKYSKVYFQENKGVEKEG